jgi:peptide chain release factor 2
LTGDLPPLGGIFDLDAKSERLTEVTRELEAPDIWNNPERAQELGRERARLEEVVHTLTRMFQALRDADELLEFAAEEGDKDILEAIGADVGRLEADISRLEFQRMFSGEMDLRMPSWISSRDPVVPRHRIGRRCCCGCTCAGGNVTDSLPN